MLLDNGVENISKERFRILLYLCVKRAQREPSLHLHRSLRNPEIYGGLPDGRCGGLDQFAEMATSMRLIVERDDDYHFLPKLNMEHTFDSIRLENLVEVYANEIAPLTGARRAVSESLREAGRMDQRMVAELRFDDAKIAYAWDKAAFAKPRYLSVNEKETASESGVRFC